MASSAAHAPPSPQTPERRAPPGQCWQRQESILPSSSSSSPGTVESLARQLYLTQIELLSSPHSQRHGSPGQDKPLPALPPARTPSQINHQRQNQHPYHPADGPQQNRTRVASAPLFASPARNSAGPSRLQALDEHRRWPQVRPAPVPSAPPSSLGVACPRLPPRHPQLEVLPPMPAFVSSPEVRPPARRPLPAPPPRVSQAVFAETPITAQKSSLEQGQYGPPDSSIQPCPPSYEMLFGSDQRPSMPPAMTARPLTSVEALPTSISAPLPAPRSTSTPAVGRKTHIPTTPDFRLPTTMKATSTRDAATPSPSAAKKGFNVSANVPPAAGQCWGIKRDGGRCTRSVGTWSRGKANTEEVGSRRSSASPTKRPGATPQRQRQKSEPPPATHLRGSAGAGPRQGKRAQPIVVSDSDSDFEPDASSGSFEDSFNPTKNNATNLSETEDEGQEALPLYCHQHAREINKTQGFHITAPRTSNTTKATPPSSLGKTRYIPFSQYIPSTLSGLTAARLRTAMVEPLSPADRAEEGYIYIYEVLAKEEGKAVIGGASRGPESLSKSNPSHSTSGQLLLKVGRSSNPMARMAQWRSQCSSREAHLRALLPLVHSSEHAGKGQQSGPAQRQGLLVGAHPVLTSGIVGSHRWEKFVHLELAERCLCTSSSPSARNNKEQNPNTRPRGTRDTMATPRCTDCGQRHREIFSVPPEVGLQGVMDIVLRWETFIREIGHVT